MMTLLGGAALNGDLTGTLATGSRFRNIQISTTAPLVGTLTVGGNGGTITSTPGLNGVQAASQELAGAMFYQLSDPADIGKARVTWVWS